MGRKLTVKVTRADIRRGLRGLADSCAIARSLRRLTGEKLVEVAGVRSKSPTVTVGRSYFRLPPAAHAWARAFDDGMPVEPFTFTLGGK